MSQGSWPNSSMWRECVGPGRPSERTWNDNTRMWTNAYYYIKEKLFFSFTRHFHILSRHFSHSTLFIGNNNVQKNTIYSWLSLQLNLFVYSDCFAPQCQSKLPAHENLIWIATTEAQICCYFYTNIHATNTSTPERKHLRFLQDGTVRSDTLPEFRPPAEWRQKRKSLNEPPVQTWRYQSDEPVSLRYLLTLWRWTSRRGHL